MSSGVLQRIDQVDGQLTPAERKVAAFVAAHLDSVHDLPISQLAQHSKVSEASVVRLCKKLHLSGYQELRLALAQDAGGRSLPDLHEDVESDDSPARILSKVISGTARTLNDTLAVVDQASLTKAVDAMRGADSLTFIGIGASGAVAQDAYFRFFKAGFTAYALTDGSSQLTRIAGVGTRDVVVAISHSGQTRDIVYAVRQARLRGAFAIGITQFGGQPLAGICDAVLFTSSRETAFRTEAMASRIAQLALLDALFIGVAMHSYDEVANRLDQARRLTAEMREPAK